jgi:hypothetical protein
VQAEHLLICETLMSFLATSPAELELSISYNTLRRRGPGNPIAQCRHLQTRLIGIAGISPPLLCFHQIFEPQKRLGNDLGFLALPETFMRPKHHHGSQRAYGSSMGSERRILALRLAAATKETTCADSGDAKYFWSQGEIGES